MNETEMKKFVRVLASVYSISLEDLARTSEANLKIINDPLSAPNHVLQATANIVKITSQCRVLTGLLSGDDDEKGDSNPFSSLKVIGG